MEKGKNILQTETTIRVPMNKENLMVMVNIIGLMEQYLEVPNCINEVIFYMDSEMVKEYGLNRFRMAS